MRSGVRVDKEPYCDFLNKGKSIKVNFQPVIPEDKARRGQDNGLFSMRGLRLTFLNGIFPNSSCQ